MAAPTKHPSHFPQSGRTLLVSSFLFLFLLSAGQTTSPKQSKAKERFCCSFSTPEGTSSASSPRLFLALIFRAGLGLAGVVCRQTLQAALSRFGELCSMAERVAARLHLSGLCFFLQLLTIVLFATFVRYSPESSNLCSTEPSCSQRDPSPTLGYPREYPVLWEGGRRRARGAAPPASRSWHACRKLLRSAFTPKREQRRTWGSREVKACHAPPSPPRPGAPGIAGTTNSTHTG